MRERAVAIYYVLFDLKTGRPKQFGHVPEEAALAGLAGAEQAVIVSDVPLQKTVELTRKPYGTVSTLDIDAVRATLKRSIDSQAFAAMGRTLPTYAEKEAEARAFVAGTIAIEETKYIKGQADITGQRPMNIAEAIIQAADDHARDVPMLETWRTAIRWKIDGEDNLTRLFALGNTPLPTR